MAVIPPSFVVAGRYWRSQPFAHNLPNGTMFRHRLPLAAALVLLCLAAVVRADVFVLKTGGTITGELLNPDQEPRQTYIVATIGGKIVLTKAEVAEVQRKSREQLLYEKYLPRMPKSAEGNWIMAEWCRGQDLDELRRHHLEQVLTYEPDHEKARLALGFNRIDGRWVIPDEFNEERGFVRHGGAWRSSQEIALEEAAKERNDAVTKWNGDLRRWRKTLIGRDADKSLLARQNIAKINDLAAAPGLAQLLEDETFLGAKLIYIEKLSQLNCQTSSDALLKCAMEDKSNQVREACWDALAEDGSPAVVASLIKELESKDNVRVNRAAFGLERMNDTAAIMPLINALVTKHKFKFVQGPPGNMQAGFRPGGGGMAFNPGRKNVDVREVDLQNRAVLNALSVLTEGTNFQFDENRWREWYARVNTPPNINLRRSE
jgi:hypothetical protein